MARWNSDGSSRASSSGLSEANIVYAGHRLVTQSLWNINRCARFVSFLLGATKPSSVTDGDLLVSQHIVRKTGTALWFQEVKYRRNLKENHDGVTGASESERAMYDKIAFSLRKT